MKNILQVVNREASDIEKEAAISAHVHFLSGRKWEKISLWIGIPSTILAAVAGITAFTDYPDYVTGGTAILVAALSAINTFLGPADRETSHKAAKVTFNRIRREASLLRDVDAPMVKEDDAEAADEIITRLRKLVTDITDAEQSAPAVSASAKEKAEKKIGQQYVKESP
jgi:hypothetical protein